MTRRIGTFSNPLRRFWAILAPIVAACSLFPLFTAPAHAQPHASIAPIQTDANLFAHHGWAVLEEPGARPALVHLPPRRRLDPATGELQGSADGVVRIVMALAESPQHVAAWGDRAFLLYGPPVDRRIRRGQAILTLYAAPSGIGGGWVYHPAGRLDTLPDLPPDLEILGFEGTEFGPAALTRDFTSGAIELRVLDHSTWRLVPLPALPASGPHPLLVGSADGVVLFTPRGTLLHGTLIPPEPLESAPPTDFSTPDADDSADPPPLPTDDRPWRATWTSRSIAALPDTPLDSSHVRAWLDDSGLIVVSSVSKQTRLARVSPAALHPIAVFDHAVAPTGLVPLGGGGRAALLWADAPRDAPARAGPPPPTDPARFRIAELSSSTGRILYSGQLRPEGPISPSEFRLLSVAMIAVMAMVLLFVLRSGGADKPVVLPDRTALPDPWRRFTAGAIDVVAAIVATGLIFRAPLGAVVGLAGSDTARSEWLFLSMLAIGAASGTIGEWFFGRSLGKLACGLLVVAAPKDASAPLLRLTLWQALLRNLFKWIFGPIAMLCLVSPDGRHRGDILARSLVLIRIEESPPDTPG